MAREGRDGRDDLDTNRFEALLEAAPVGAAVIDASGRYVWVNAALAAMNGLPAAEHTGRAMTEVLPAKAAAAGLAFLEEALDGRPLQGVELVVPLSDTPDDVRTFVQSWYAIDSEGPDRACAALVWEVSEQRSAQVKALASSERLALALEGGGMGTWDWDLRRGRVRWDAGTAAIFGIAPEDFPGTIEGFGSFVHPDDRAATDAAIAEAIARRGEFRREFRVTRPDGDVRWVSSRGRVLTGEDGEPDTMAGVVQDRTEIHTEGERFARTLETMHDAFFRLDADGRFTFVNGEAERILRRSRHALLGERVGDVLPGLAAAPFAERYAEVRDGGGPVTFETQLPGLGAWVEVRAHPDGDGLAVHARDVSERKARERERQRLTERRQQAHLAAARLLDVAPDMHAHASPESAAGAACTVGRSVFACERVSLWRIGGEVATILAQDGGKPLPVGSHHPIADLPGMREVLDAGRPAFFASGDGAVSPAERALAERDGARAFLYAPVELGGAGTLVASVNWAEPLEDLDETMLDVAAQFAQQTALAMEQGRRRQAQTEASRLSSQLQSSLLPVPRPIDTRLEVASLYQPGERRLLLGGDFYDVLRQSGGEVALVIGDVTGHGPEAAAIGASLRAGWRTLALRGAPPAEAVAVLDALLLSERITDEQLVSICCAQLTADHGALRVALAGHPPPVLVTADGWSLVPAPAGLLLGLPMEERAWEEATLALPDRWALLLYTDGLPEARRSAGSADRIGIEGFAAQVAAHDPLAAPSGQVLLTALQRDIREAAGEPIDDDVALLLVRSVGAAS